MSGTDPGYLLVDGSSTRPDAFCLDVLIIEKAVTGPQGRWYIAGVLARPQGKPASWVGEPMQQDNPVSPDDAFSYWADKDGNGYTNAVFYYWAKSLTDVEDLVQRRAQELESGITAFGEAATDTPWTPQWPDKQPDQVPPTPMQDDPDQFDEGLHENCERLAKPRTVSQALVWRLCSELVRRHPDRLWVTVEGGGMYDRITVIDRSKSPAEFVATLNAAGTNSALRDGSQMYWSDAYRDHGDPAGWLVELEHRCRLPAREGRLPPSTPASLAARWVAAFLASQLGGRHHWLTVRGSADQVVEQAPGLQPAVDWLRHQPQYPQPMVWLAVLEDVPTPRLAVSITGDLWRDDASKQSLRDLHRDGEPITALLLKTVPDLLP